MTPSILQPLFQQWREEGLSFCVTSENYNRGILPKGTYNVSAGGGGELFRYPNQELLEANGSWIEQNNYQEPPPKFLPKWQIDAIANLLISQNKPVTHISLMTTSYCNYFCPKCPWHGDNVFSKKYYQKNPELRLTHMPLDMAKKIVDKCFDYGIKDIELTPQGEFFLYPQWEQLFEHMTKLGIGITVVSNGSLFTEALVSKLKSFNINKLTISIDTLKWEVFKKIRSDNKKLFENTINSIFRMQELSIKKGVNHVEGPDNPGEFESIFDFYKEANVDRFLKIREFPYYDESAINKENVNSEYPVSLCNIFGHIYNIAIDGTALACCAMTLETKVLGDKTQNLNNVSLKEALECINQEFINTRLNGLCDRCHAYRASIVDKKEMAVYKKYVVLKNQVTEEYVKVPQELSSLPDDVLIYMFQNNLVAKMKADKILDY